MPKLSATTFVTVRQSRLPRAVMTITALLVAGSIATGCSTASTVKPTATVIMGAHTSL